MSATGLGVTFYGGPLPWTGASAGAMVVFLADRDYTITHLYLANISKTANADIELGLTFGGAPMTVNDGRKFLRRTLLPEEVIDLGTRVPLKSTWSLCATASMAIGEEMVYGAITGEVSD